MSPEIQRLREILGENELPTPTMGTLILKNITHQQERTEKVRKHPTDVHKVWCGAAHICKRAVDVYRMKHCWAPVIVFWTPEAGGNFKPRGGIE